MRRHGAADFHVEIGFDATRKDTGVVAVNDDLGLTRREIEKSAVGIRERDVDVAAVDDADGLALSVVSAVIERAEIVLRGKILGCDGEEFSAAVGIGERRNGLVRRTRVGSRADLLNEGCG